MSWLIPFPNPSFYFFEHRISPYISTKKPSQRKIHSPQKYAMRGLDPLPFFFVDCFSTCVQCVCVTVCSNWEQGGLPGNNERLGSTLDAVVSQRLAEAEKHTKRGTARVAQWGLADAHLPHPANLYAEWEALGKGGESEIREGQKTWREF